MLSTAPFLFLDRNIIIMDQKNESSPSALQRKIIHLLAAEPSDPVSHIADELDCSKSYVRQTRREYNDRLDNLEDFSDITYEPSFSNPYSIFLTSEGLSHFSLESGDLLEITATYEENQEITYGNVKEFYQGWINEEHRARTHAAYFITQDLQEEIEWLLNDFPTLGDGRADPGTDEELRYFISQIQRLLDQSLDLDPPDMIIGVGILEVIHGERDPHNLISTPYFNFEERFLLNYFSGDTPTINEIRLYLDEISSPDEVFFTHYSERLTSNQKNMFREKIISQRYFKSTWNYVLPNAPSFVGPTITELTQDVIEIQPEALEIVPGVEQTVQFYNQDGDIVSDGLNVTAVFDAIRDANPQIDSLDATRSSTDGSLPIRRDGDHISFLFDQVTLSLHPRGDRMVWGRPADIEILGTLINAVNKMVKAQLGFSDLKISDPELPQRERVGDSQWALDTNALYHDHVADQPTTILHTVFAHLFFEGSTFHIPWAVLFEFNKHADRGEGTNPQNKQGFENLATLKTLDQLEYLSVEVQPLPEEIYADMNIADIADLYMLAHAEQQSARLITGDHTLEDIGNLCDIPVVNVSDLQTLTAPTSELGPEEEVLPKIGLDLHTEDEIKSSINSLINSDATVPVPETSQSSSHDSASILKRWYSKKEIVRYHRETDEKICYAKRRDITVVATESVLTQLPDYVDDNQERLTDTFRTKLSNTDKLIADDEFPQLELVIPTEYIITHALDQQRPSDFNQKLLQLQAIENISYRTEPAFGAVSSSDLESTSDLTRRYSEASEFISSSDYAAVSLVNRIDEGYLFVDGDQNGIWKFSKLLGVDAIQLDD